MGQRASRSSWDWGPVLLKCNNRLTDVRLSNVAPSYISISTVERLHQLPNAHPKHNILECCKVHQRQAKKCVHKCASVVLNSIIRTSCCNQSLLAIMSQITCLDIHTMSRPDLGNAAFTTANQLQIAPFHHCACKT